MQVYTEDATDIRSVSAAWESMWKLANGASGDPWVAMGRVHAQHQRALWPWLLKVGRALMHAALHAHAWSSDVPCQGWRIDAHRGRVACMWRDAGAHKDGLGS